MWNKVIIPSCKKSIPKLELLNDDDMELLKELA